MPGSTPETFLRTKIRVLRPPQGTIERPRLETLRHEAQGVRLVTLTAPGGFGKSTLAAAWVAQWQDEGHHCAWLSLAQDDDEPARFIYSLVQALRSLGVGDAAQSLLQSRALTAPRTVVSLLLNDLEALDGKVFLVLDDYQWIQDAEIHDALAFFITHAPPHLHLIITTRVTPPLTLARLRAHGQWLDVDAATLRFDEEETRRFLTETCAQAPSPKQMSQLHASTEGWAAALRLVALGRSLNRVIDMTETEGSSSIFATLFEDLLQHLPPATVRFMARTAVLERLHPDLCQAICQEDADSDEHLSRLRQYHLLIDSV